MAVYTHVSDEALAAFLANYDIGNALSFKGIAEGVENSNYLLETTTGKFILTLFEKRVDATDLPYFIGLKRYLATQGYPCPEPILAKDGRALQALCDRPAIIVSFLEGLSPKTPTVKQCRQLGAGLAQMHLALSGFDMTRENSLGPDSWPKLWTGLETAADTLENGLSAAISTDISDVMTQKSLWHSLPQGTIHADLFPDNAFFLGDIFSGAIDFYFACSGALAFDLAICLNAWAFEDGTDKTHYRVNKATALIEGYQSVRRLSAEEIKGFPTLARGAAIRFFLTRLKDQQEIRPGAIVTPKNPQEYVSRLAIHRQVKDFSGYVG